VASPPFIAPRSSSPYLLGEGVATHEVEDREALLHAREESADSRAKSLSLQEAGLAVREAEARECERELRLREEQLHASEDRLAREREVGLELKLETRELNE
jgi:hypothetical protein